jgi:nicotinate-nucleotide pyrophosphorylase (carboxylating)
VQSDFTQLDWNDEIEDDCRQIVRLAVREDLGRFVDLTTVALVDRERRGSARMVSRDPGVVAGLRAARVALDEMDIAADWQETVADGQGVTARTTIAEISGSARDLLTSERILLNLVSRLSGIATLTRAYVQRVAGTQARIYDTRKTTPGWRRLEKYAVRCGGGRNHRTGLFDAVLIKDNHLAIGGAKETGGANCAEAVVVARQFLAGLADKVGLPRHVPIEIEVDSLEQFASAIDAGPDIILLDNMSLDELREAVRRRDVAGSGCELEASGGVTLQSVRAIAETGVDRISVGALTHSAVWLDVGLDWVIPAS